MEVEKKNPNVITLNKTEETGVVYGNIGVGETTYEMNKFHARQGHGFAAERSEHIHDLYHGKDAQILGDDNLKDGADRLVNGVEIQSKYCRNGSACIAECFENGKYRYFSDDGEPMLVEVPSDMYDDAIRAMRRRIENKEVPGISSPDNAEKLVKKGNFTYEQVKRIAQAGTIESLSFDAANGIIIARDTMGISSLLTFATSVWNGESFETALQNAVLSGLKVGGVSFLTTVISSQLARTSITATVRAGADLLVSQLGSNVTAHIVNALQNGTNIYGAAAMNNVSKLITGNLIAGTVSMVVLSSFDLIDLFRGRISGEQFLKNTAVTGATIVGGNVGWIAGNAIGATTGGAVGGALTGGTGAVVGAKIGSKVGGFVGSIAGGTMAGSLTHEALDAVIEDDSKEMLRLVEEEFIEICKQYILVEDEVEEALSRLKEQLTSEEMKNIFASDQRSLYIQSIIMECVNPTLSRRVVIENVREEDILLGLRILIEDAINGEGIFGKDEIVPSISQMKTSLLQNSNVRDEQLSQIMQPVLKMNKTQKKVEITLNSMKRSNDNSYKSMKEIKLERQILKNELQRIMEK